MCNPIYCLTPPHLLQAIIERGCKERYNSALHTLVHTERLRGHRHVVHRYNLNNSNNQGLYRVVQSAGDKENLTGTVIRKEGDSLSGDIAVDEAYAFTGDVYNFYHQVFKRNSIDDKGMQLYSTVHYGQDFDNAFWNGERMVFGDGDGKVFQRFTKCPEVIGHELTHGVTQTSSKLAYQGQSGALNEAISDVFGCLVKQFIHDQTAHEASWIIGEGLFESSINGVGVRNIKDPGTAYDDPVLGKDPCPASMAHYVRTSQDNGGIHINCTIPSHAFYISAVTVGGKAWETIGPVWYDVLTNKLEKKCTFKQWAAMTIQSAIAIYGKKHAITKAVRKGWKLTKVI